MTYGVHVPGSVRRYIGRLDRATQARVLTKIDEIAAAPWSGAISKPLHEAGGLRSARVGNLRILYEVDEAVRVVEITDIGPRGDVYRSL